MSLLLPKRNCASGNVHEKEAIRPGTSGATDDAISRLYTGLLSDGIFIFEEDTPYFQETLLQIIWNEQLLRSPVVLECGAELEVIYAGTWNLEAGPDFRGAALQLNGKFVRGDVEVHFRPEDWQKHRHDQSPDYRHVILHVAWDNPRKLTAFPPNVPILKIRNYLTIPIQELISRFDVLGYPYAKKVQPGHYSQFIAALEDEQLADLLQSYGIARILTKAETMARAMAADGLERAVYDAFFDALGYKSNRQGFRQLAAQINLTDLDNRDPATTLSILFGAAGLLPDPSQCQVHPDYREWVEEMWSSWWSRREQYAPIQWRRANQRPQNVPERRLLAGHMVLEKNQYKLGNRIIAVCASTRTVRATVRDLQRLFQIDMDDFNSRFLNFTKQLQRPTALLGKNRINDFIVNFCIPVFIADGFIKNHPQNYRRAREILLAVPKLQDNRRLKEAVHKFFIPPSRSKDVIINAAAQQGLIKLHDNTAHE